MKIKILHNLLEQINSLYSELTGHYQTLLGDTQKITEITAKLDFKGENQNAVDSVLSALLETLGNRQKAMEQVDSVKTDIQPLEAGVEEILHLQSFDLAKIIQMSSTPVAHQLAEKQQEITELLLKITHLDQTNQKHLVEKIGEVRQELNRIHQGKVARTGYELSSSNPSESRFIDNRE